MTFRDVTNAQGTCRNINHVIQGECFQVQPGSAHLWKRAFPLPPTALLSKHTQFTKNFLFFTWFSTVCILFSNQHEESMVQPRGPSPDPTAVLPSVLPLPERVGRSTCLHCRGKAGCSHGHGQQPGRRVTKPKATPQVC